MDEPLDPVGTDPAARLVRRVTFGTAPGRLPELASMGAGDLLDTLMATDPTAAGPFAGVDPAASRDMPAQVLGDGLAAWLDHMVAGERPVETFMTWFWHDHFAVSGRVVRVPELMFAHVELLRRHALGNFADLVAAVTVDAAMLRFLDGDTSTAGSPNENYGRELLELYTLGVGNFSEDDVRSAAVALTGWTVQRGTGRAVFRAGRHDDTPQVLVGVDGVHDVDTVVAAVTADPSCAHHVAGSLASAVLGTVDDETLDRLAEVFASADLELAPLVRAVLELCLDGAGTDIVSAPVPWWVRVRKAYDADVDQRLVAGALQAAGQVPLAPPNVGGFPPGPSYLSAAATTARVNLAAAAALASPAGSEAHEAAAAGDATALAALLGLPGGFGPPTVQALDGLDDPRHRLAVAAAAPEAVIV